jgi:hypothetical protein
MAIVNRRNALFGWLVWRIAKRLMKQKAEAAVPSIDTDSRRPNRAAVAAVIAALAGAVYAWVRLSGDDEEEIV